MYFNSNESRERHRLANVKKNNAIRLNNIQEYDKNPSKCGNCGKALPYDKRTNKFCNRSCSASYNNKGVTRHGNEPNNCLWCGKKLKQYNRKYCSRSCVSEYTYKTYINRWLLGLEHGVRSKDGGIDAKIRRWIFEKNKNKCQKCGWGEIHEVTDKIPLTIHHKDGNCKNNKETNIDLLCPNCHCLTETYGSLNIGNSKRYRYRY